MIGPDDIGEGKSANHTPTIALSIAAVLLLAVGALSYKDVLRTKLEKEYAEKEARLMERFGQPAGPVSPAAQAPAGVAAGSPPGGVPAPTTVLYDAQGNPVYLTGNGTLSSSPVPVNPAGQAPRPEAEIVLPVPEDPDIANMKASLNQAREQSRLTEQRFNELAGEGDPSAREAAAIAASRSGGDSAVSAELPDFLRNAVNNPPGGNPEIEAQLERLRARVAAAPSLAQVTSYDKDWGVVTFDAGASQGVKVDQRFAVRRGSEVLGWVKVDQVDAEQAVAVLVTKNADDETSTKPAVGDDLIDFEL